MVRWLAVLPVSWQQRYQRWLARRIPARTSLKLNQRNLFIFLSQHGLYFLLLISLVWIGATNFQNNLAFGLSFFLLAVLFVAIHLTFANASGLQLRFVDVHPVFAGEVAWIRLELSSAGMHQQLEFSFPQQESVLATVQPLLPSLVLIPHSTRRRGVLRPGRFRMQTFYPLGIVRCWSWLDLAVEILVYPQPLEADYRHCCSGSGAEEGLTVVGGGDEFFALKPYVQGESLSRVAWKPFAAGRGLFVREYASVQGGDVMLDWSVLNEPNLEIRLSKLCYCALQLHEQGRSFGLRLPELADIAPASGEGHLRQILYALATYRL